MTSAAIARPHVATVLLMGVVLGFIIDFEHGRFGWRRWLLLIPVFIVWTNLHGGVVNDFHWLDERQFLDAVAVAMITPGPVVITVAFIGYLVGGLAGAAVATVAIFIPSYLGVIVPGPWFVRSLGW